MTCGDPDDPDCSQVLAQVYAYLDGEMSAQDVMRIKQHLDDCGPCLREFDLDVALKALVRRSCGCEQAPADLRERIMVQISEVRIQLGN